MLTKFTNRVLICFGYDPTAFTRKINAHINSLMLYFLGTLLQTKGIDFIFINII